VCRYGGRYISDVPDFQSGGLKPKPPDCCFNLAHLQDGAAIANIGHDRQIAETGQNLTQEFDPFAGKFRRLD
jgi:hypothetical protein